MAIKNKNVIPTNVPVTSSITTKVNISPAQRGANRVIGAIDNVSPPAAGTKGIEPVWKDALEPLQIGQSRPVTGIGEKSLIQAVMKTVKKNWPERKYRVWVEKKAEDNNGVEVLRVGRLEDKKITSPVTTTNVQTVETLPDPTLQYTAENPPPGYYYDPTSNSFVLLPQTTMQGV